MQRYSLARKPHQIFYDDRSYEDLQRDYEISPAKIQKELLLVVAKSYFIQHKYEKCLEVIREVDEMLSPKTLFEKVSLQFRATYLKDRRQKITKQMLQNLGNILASFKKITEKFDAEAFRDGHKDRIGRYKRFLSFLNQSRNDQVRFDYKIFREKITKQKNTKQFEGFPCYLISEEWLDDFADANSMVGNSKKQIYIGPLTNFHLVNDLYENYLLEYSVRNEFIFPTNRYRVLNRNAWKYYCEHINGKREFLPVKRLFRETSSYSSYSCRNWFVSLVPLLIQCEEQQIALQVTVNGNLTQELLPILEKNFGIGQLKKKSKHSEEMEILDLDNQLKELDKMHTLLVFQKIKERISLLEKKNIYPLLKFDLSLLDPQEVNNAERGLKGLQNLVNSCYMNACLQCLSFTEQIMMPLTTTSLIKELNFQQTDGVITLALADVFKNLWMKNERRSFSPHKFKKYFGMKNTMFSGKTQEDAHQFLLQLLNNIHEELKKVNQKALQNVSKLEVTTDKRKVRKYFQKHELQQNKSLITKTMRGIIHSSILCKNCKTVSHSYDVFLALSLPIPHKVIPSLFIYFVGDQAKHTQKYEVYLEDIRNVEDIFTIFKREVFKQEGKNNAYIMICVSKKSFKLKGELGELNFADGALSKATSIRDLVQSSQACQIIIYELKKREKDQEMLLIEYCSKNLEKFAFPRAITVLPEQFLKGPQSYVTDLVLNSDKENYIRFSQIVRINSSEVKDSRFLKFRLQVIFRKREKFFYGSSIVDHEINVPVEKYTLNDCFNFMKEPEILENSWVCGQCKSNKRGEKKEQLVDANNILIISLKRFKADYRKIKSMVTYPVEDLNINEWLEEKSKAKQIYDLYAVCLHQGSVDCGHYRAYCKHFASGDWYEFDDSVVKRIDPADVVTPQAYMLFYKRKDI